jgi:hypothetical protein
MGVIYSHRVCLSVGGTISEILSMNNPIKLYTAQSRYLFERFCDSSAGDFYKTKLYFLEAFTTSLST